MLRVLLASATGLAAMQWTTPASACGPRPPELLGRPRDGNTGVPTDVIPYYDQYAASFDVNRLPAARFVLTSATGEVIPMTPTHRPFSTFELTPERILSPRTTYELHGTWTVPVSRENPTGTIDRSLEFTSGAGPYGNVPAAPIAGVEHYLLHDIDGTALSAGSCIFASSDLPIEATFFVGGEDGGAESSSRLYMGPFFDNLSGVMQHTDHDCVRLRLRAPNGDMSAPTVVCRNDGPFRTLTVNDPLPCTSQGMRPVTDAGAEPPSDVITGGSAGRSPEYGPGSAASCSVVGAHESRGSAWGMSTGLSIVTAWCRRRRAGRSIVASSRCVAVSR